MYCEWISEKLSSSTAFGDRAGFMDQSQPKRCASGRFLRRSDCPNIPQKTTRPYKDHIEFYFYVIYHNLRQGFCEVQSDSESKQISAGGTEYNAPLSTTLFFFMRQLRNRSEWLTETRSAGNRSLFALPARGHALIQPTTVPGNPKVAETVVQHGSTMIKKEKKNPVPALPTFFTIQSLAGCANSPCHQGLQVSNACKNIEPMHWRRGDAEDLRKFMDKNSIINHHWPSFTIINHQILIGWWWLMMVNFSHSPINR